MASFIVTISLGGVIFLLVTNHFSGDALAEEKLPSIEEVVEASVDIPEIVTSISNNNFARVSMTIQTDSAKAGKELSLREFQVKDIIIEELSEISRAELQGREGKEAFEEIVKSRVNELMQEGEVIKIYTTSFVVQ
ncbi:flagellar basal body-associated protein FliL [Jeotgalibacillus proteolyticus]|uniref:Flagellar protein FliL n=2 Tax=Jeotgalibacillus proteolyticus TaxID=2082395 RepID=A0A2S5GHF0_9BACL|nr:flagellar basal body-associated protein FliL [Jeotgalibacillus proteolyticus]